nr:isocitrate lyase/phosphoenolpyruvate mutase family protein [uncultured Actinoplanes sp.]
MTAASFRDLLAADHVTHVPGVFDPVSAALAVRAGSRAVHLSGAAIAATLLARPGVEHTPATQIADRAATVSPVLGGVPMLADADAGYENRSDAVWTALAYERSGISALHLDDGENAALAAARIAELAARVPQIVLIARATGTGMADTIARCRAYADAGADAVLPVGVDDRAGLGRIRAAVPGVRLAISRAETATGGSTPTDAELAAYGVRLVLHPLAAVRAALEAMASAYRRIAEEGTTPPDDLLPWAEFTELTGQVPVPPAPFIHSIPEYAVEPTPPPWLAPPRSAPARSTPVPAGTPEADLNRLGT